MSKRLLPLIPAGLAVVQVLPTPEHVTIVTQPQAVTATCPDCGTTSRRIHSHYERLLGPCCMDPPSGVRNQPGVGGSALT